jgi:UDP-N-acetyl-D-galactosamine dehydrogenase
MNHTLSNYLNGEKPVAIVGLGYVGLPLAAAFSKKFRVVGFDISQRRIDELKTGKDVTRELSPEQLASAKIEYTTDAAKLGDCGVIIVTVPTPIDDSRNPDLTPLQKASTTVGKAMKPGTIVVYESTVYPGVTEDECVPVLEKVSGLKWGRDFHVGYSPERINPGDKEHTVEKILKVVAGDTPEVGKFLNGLYGAIITAGTHLAPNIKTAEAAKVIENTQRDLNIALMNELSLIFEKIGISTSDVLAAAGTKWNFLKFTPGLVGGHCIGVDPYYLTWKAQSLGYEPEVILAGRRINDAMGKHVAERTVKQMIRVGAPVKGGRVLILGFTFKENVPDIRNTKVVDIRTELMEYGVSVDVCDPHGYNDEVEHEYGFRMVAQPDGEYDAVILAVKHKALVESLTIEKLAAFFGPRPKVVMDLKGFFPKADLESSGFTVWSL